MTFTHALSTNNYGESKFIVSSNPANGTHTTIASALAVATSGDTIFIRNGTYTENLTLVAGVNLTAYEADAFTPNVTISGTCTFTAAGTVSISGIRLQTNSAFALAITGSSASIVNLFGCYLNGVNNTIISFTSSSASASLFTRDCFGDLTTTGIALFAHSSAGRFRMVNSFFLNTGVSTTANTVSAGEFFPNLSHIENPLTISGTATFSSGYFSILCTPINSTALTFTTTTTGADYYGRYFSGTASAISIGAGATLQVDFATVNSSNANAITGAGTIQYGMIVYTSSSSTNNVTTQTQFITQPFGQILPFTPAITFGGASVGITYTTQSGFYIRVNNTVFFGFNITMTSKGSSVGGAAITGFPVAAGTNAGVGQRPNIGQIAQFTFSANTNGDLYLRFANASTTAEIHQSASGTVGTTQAADTNFANTTILSGNGFYFLN